MQNSLTSEQNEIEYEGDQVREKNNHHFSGYNGYDIIRVPGRGFFFPARCGSAFNVQADIN